MTTRVVACDDEVHIIRAISMKLTKSGYAVETANDGQEAWEAIQRERPDVVVTDLQMPRMDGLQLIRTMRDNPDTADIPVILLTAKGFEVDDVQLELELNLRVVPKPFSPRELVKTVEELHSAVSAGE